MAVARNEEAGDICRGDWSRKRIKLRWRLAIVLEVTLVLKSSPTAASALPTLL